MMLIENAAVELVVLTHSNGGTWLAPVQTATPKTAGTSAHRLKPPIFLTFNANFNMSHI